MGGGKSDLLLGGYQGAEHIFSKLLKNKRVLLILSASSPKNFEVWEDVVKKRFGKYVKELDILNEFKHNDKNLRKINGADVYFFSGGLPDKSLDLLNQEGLLSEIKKNKEKIFLGISAGALSFCEDCIITKDEDYEFTKIVKGMGFVNFSIEVHYAFEEWRDKELLKLSSSRKIYALGNKSLLFFDSLSEKMEFYGEIYLFENKLKHLISS